MSTSVMLAQALIITLSLLLVGFGFDIYMKLGKKVAARLHMSGRINSIADWYEWCRKDLMSIGTILYTAVWFIIMAGFMHPVSAVIFVVLMAAGKLVRARGGEMYLRKVLTKSQSK